MENIETLKHLYVDKLYNIDITRHIGEKHLWIECGKFNITLAPPLLSRTYRQCITS